jgi:peptidyl-prolyl cis-trans isomerase A (cyclophilin A)
MRTRSVLLLSLVMFGCDEKKTGAPTPPPPVQAAPTPPAPPPPVAAAEPKRDTTLTDTTAGAPKAEDPVPGHVLPLEEALKGVKGSGTLLAKIDIEQNKKPLGTFTCELYEKEAPKTVSNFVGLARGVRPWKDAQTGEWVKKPLYDGLIFHRVIPEFMIQGGDPKGNGTGEPGYTFEDETANGLTFDKPGLLAMANRGPGTNGSQFFVTEAQTISHLNGRHTVFGLCAPVDLVKKIARVQRGPGDRPTDPVIIKKVTISRGTPKKK